MGARAVSGSARSSTLSGGLVPLGNSRKATGTATLGRLGSDDHHSKDQGATAWDEEEDEAAAQEGIGSDGRREKKVVPSMSLYRTSSRPGTHCRPAIFRHLTVEIYSSTRYLPLWSCVCLSGNRSASPLSDSMPKISYLPHRTSHPVHARRNPEVWIKVKTCNLVPRVFSPE